MQRISHGATLPPSDESPKSYDEVLKELGKVADDYFFPQATKQAKSPRFFHMFKHLADDAKCLIPHTEKTLNQLSELGNAMRDTKFDVEFNSKLPAVLTYFAQFINHDINFTDVKRDEGRPKFEILASQDLEPWSEVMLSERVSNRRAGMLELDCVYGRMQGDVLPPRFKDNHDKMALGTVTKSGNRPPGTKQDEFHDVVRGPMSRSFKTDRTALIADRRNDSNIILSQLHVAFLRAHNRIIDMKKCSYEEAKQILTQHYHWLILDTFLRALVPEEIINDVLANKKPLYNAANGLPFEFSAGAFRFGHSMIRPSYYYNHVNQGTPLESLFTPVALTENSGKPTPNEGFPTLPEHQIIQWPDFLSKNKARQIRTQMVEPLFKLLEDMNIPGKGEPSLAVQDLKRSFMMRIPTGQQIARELGVKILSADDFKTHCPTQVELLKGAEMLECTPLSFYVLAEAQKADAERQTKTGQLGGVGGRIVAEVLIGVLRDHPDSIIDTDWKPDPKFGLIPGTFILRDLLLLAGVL